MEVGGKEDCLEELFEKRREEEFDAEEVETDLDKERFDGAGAMGKGNAILGGGFEGCLPTTRSPSFLPSKDAIALSFDVSRFFFVTAVVVEVEEVDSREREVLENAEAGREAVLRSFAVKSDSVGSHCYQYE